MRCLHAYDGTLHACDGPVRPCATSAAQLASRSTGKERDAESGNDYFGARYYASTMGRWLSPDWSEGPEAIPYASYTNPQSLNLYNYVLNNPLRNRDSDGHHCDPDSSYTDRNGNTVVVAGKCELDWWDLPGHAFVGLGNLMLKGHEKEGLKQMGYAYGQGLLLATGVGEGEGLIELGLEAPDAVAAARGGLGPVLQGVAGVEKAVAEIESEGGSVVAREVTIENSAGRARVDVVYRDASGELKFGEAKNGPTAKLNANQTKVYERMKSEGARLVGKNASNAGLPSNVGASSVRLFKY